VSFSGFDPAAVALLAELPGWGAERFAAEKPRLTAGLVRPGLALVAEVAARLDAHLTVTSRSSVSPLHRDLRFAGSGAPRYKDHLLLTAWEGSDKRSAPTLWVRVDSHRVGFASGLGFTPEVRDRWRAAIGGPEGVDLGASLARLAGDRGVEIAGDQLARVPPPFGEDHPRADLLRRTAFQVRLIEDLPDCVGQAAFGGWCADRLTRLLPVHRWLVRHLT
jgi:hypothetical protein